MPDENEYFKIFDEERNEIGVASRSDVHKFGHWHETFHCWFVTKHEGKDYVYLQLRSEDKQDYPNLLDITVAGHLTADEAVQDGIREIQEEVGIDVPFTDLKKLGIIKYCVTKEHFIDNEFAHVFIYHSNHDFEDFIIQPDEVAGIVRAEWKQFSELWLDDRETIKVRGFKINKEGNREGYTEYIKKDRFVPHERSFYKEVILKIKEQM